MSNLEIDGNSLKIEDIINIANNSVDGAGFTEKIIVGGSSDYARNDKTDPIVELFMNDSNFAFGGLTDENPSIYALISDDNGINTSGTSLGHDISAVLDNDYSNPFLLNDFYIAALNSYKKGRIIYPLNELSEGNHTLSLKVWDVNNNSSKQTIDFIVQDNQDISIEKVYNYPNPFTTQTEFLFEHNQACNSMDVQIQVFTVSGKLVKSINQNVNTNGYRINGINWNGKDEYGAGC